MVLLSTFREIKRLIEDNNYPEPTPPGETPRDTVMYRCWKLFNAILTGALLPPGGHFRTVTVDPGTQHYRWPPTYYL